MMIRRRCRGFTLLEVMVALVIVALSLTAVAASMNQMIRSAQTLRDRTYASWIAQNRIAEIRLAPAAPDIGASNGEVVYANIDWGWRAVISETDVEDLLRIDVSVSFAGSNNVIHTVTGFVGPPGAPAEANRAWSRSIVIPAASGSTS